MIKLQIKIKTRSPSLMWFYCLPSLFFSLSKMIYIRFDLYVSPSIGEFIQCMCGCLCMPEEGFEYTGA